jgi:hypothetical protein
VAALQTLLGMALVTAATLIAELGDLSRFVDPRQLIACIGLVPSEHSSGTSIRRGGLTKAGNRAAHRLLIEAAWCYRSRRRSAATCGCGRKIKPIRSMASPVAAIKSTGLPVGSAKPERARRNDPILVTEPKLQPFTAELADQAIQCRRPVRNPAIFPSRAGRPRPPRQPCLPGERPARHT